MTDGLWGFEVLAGGIDSVNVTSPAHSMSASSSLVRRRTWDCAAEHDWPGAT